jgi:hypothetical protein
MESFPEFVYRSRINRIYAGAALGGSMLLWIVFKYCYPHPNLVFDSYHYIRAAVLKLGVNGWPIGYSIFLRFFTLFSHSANLLVTCQFLMLNLSSLLFFYSWIYIFKPGRFATNIVFLLLFVNPLFLYMANYILADPLFISLSILWIVQLMWIIIAPRPIYLLTQAILLTAVFTVRYNALYFPLITVLAFIFSRQPRWRKGIGIGLTFLMLAGFVLYTCRESKRVFGTSQFSAFGGWKLANDALYVYDHMATVDQPPIPAAYKGLDSVVKDFYQHNPDWNKPDDGEPSSGSYFMFEPQSPLIQYMEMRYGGGWPYFSTQKWFSVAPLYQDYGECLLSRHPGLFIRYFLWPNLGNYVLPPREVLGSPVPFVMHESFGATYVRTLFGLTSLDTDERYIRMSNTILCFYPAIFAMLHFFFLLGYLTFWFTGGLKNVSSIVAKCVLLIGGLWLLDFGFGLLSASIVLRYQIFVGIIELGLGIYCMEFAYRQLQVTPSSG